MGDKLGEGSHCVVYKCFRRLNPRSPDEATTPLRVDKMQSKEFQPGAFAVKIVRSDDLEKMMAHKRESEILHALSHTNVVNGIEMFEDKFKNQIFQVIEYIDGQEILDEIADGKGLSESFLQVIILQIL